MKKGRLAGKNACDKVIREYGSIESRVHSLNIKQIRYFASTVAHGSLSAAAKEEYVSVQAISKSLSDLERELGYSLFSRKSHGISPTPFGSAFLREAAPVLKGFERLEAFAGRWKGGGQPQRSVFRLALCAPPFYNFDQACRRIAALVQQITNADATMTLAPKGKGLNGLHVGEYDALITLGAVSHPAVDCVAVGAVPLGVLMAKDHPCVARDEVRLDDLKTYPVLTSEGFELFNDVVVSTYRKRGVEIACRPMTTQEAERFLREELGLVLAVGIPALGGMLPGATMRLMRPEDGLPITVCLVTMKGDKRPEYRALESTLASGLVVLASETFE